jgi:hypothetical protein
MDLEREEGEMSPTPRVVREPVMDETQETVNKAAEVRTNALAVFARAVDRMAHLQKLMLDVATQQNAEMVDLYKNVLQKLPGTPRLPMLEVAVTTFERLADTQKHAVDLAVEQTHSLVDTLKERVSAANKTTESTMNLTNQVIERSVAVQKKVLENSVAQTKVVLDAVRQQMGFSGSPVEVAATSFQRGVDTLVEVQKEMLDMVAH